MRQDHAPQFHGILFVPFVPFVPFVMKNAYEAVFHPQISQMKQRHTLPNLRSSVHSAD